jgi:hypothetical protein
MLHVAALGYADQGCQIFRDTKTGKMYQMNTKCTK